MDRRALDRRKLESIDLSKVVIDTEIVRIATAKYLRGLPALFEVYPSRSQVDEWDQALLGGEWREWAENHGYKTTFDVPDEIRHLLAPHVDFAAFKDFWNESHFQVRLVNPDLSFMNTSKTWADHIAGYISHTKFLKKQK
ncbi:hypothetical protein [Massilia sp. NP310]|uniref:hypothetical protein n=1 Tax=Massilia sp. NP310 TaxID=2861282 RepID=UPI001C62D706|nr:hypothetical protein [Massilia sp. NP310]QYG04026.1 hypothetical protein KY496_11910 [Massilia sp. NP310]